MAEPTKAELQERLKALREELKEKTNAIECTDDELQQAKDTIEQLRGELADIHSVNENLKAICDAQECDLDDDGDCEHECETVDLVLRRDWAREGWEAGEDLARVKLYHGLKFHELARLVVDDYVHESDKHDELVERDAG